MEWVNIAGLICDIVGASWLAWGLFLSRDKAIELGVSRFAGDTTEEQLQLPAVKDRLRQSRNAQIGMLFLITGFVLQIIASWPT
jgi:hypothetical protein